MTTPLVSCIMPTRNRRRFVSQSIWYFLRQDYSARELIVIDDGEDAISDLVPKDDRIRYIHLPSRTKLGAKRNLACEISKGELIAHWDDDDWIAPHRLSVQVRALQELGADACGIRDLLHFNIESGEAWLYRFSSNERPWLAGNTLLYRREAWARHHFPDINVGEDTAFIWQLSADKLYAMPDTSFYVALIHSGNTAYKNLKDSHWQKRPFEEVKHLIDSDREFYVNLRNGKAWAPTPLPTLPSITLCAPFRVYDGYGSMAEYLAVGMTRAGATVNLVPLGIDLTGTSNEFQQIMKRSRPEVGVPVLYFCWPRPELEQFRKNSELFINTMYESSRLPESWIGQMNRARAVIVPTRFVARVCCESGITAPVVVIPEGIDPDVYHYEERPDRPGLTTLTIGPLDNRKHVSVGVAAWKQIFANDPDARLIIKTQYNYQNYVPDDPRILYIDVHERTRGIAHWYRQADVLLALGNEGFGLPLVEGMATGLPVIALDSEGQADVCEEASDCLLPIQPAHWQEFNSDSFGPSGVRGVPSVEAVADQLNWVATHRAEAREIGRAASVWALQHRNIWVKGPAVLTVMEHHAQPPRPLRWSRTIWVPSWGTPCGIAEYTMHLSQEMGYMRVSSDAPKLAGVRTLLVQHENALFDDLQLTRYIQSAREARLPVIVTEHAVHQAHAWEHDANILLALTRHGAETLRQRWGDKRVRYIPHGCPQWFPPRKTVRDKVIGVFGFLGMHKGFWRLLDVLRAIPDAELLMFSYAKSQELEKRWAVDSYGLPIRRISEFLPAQEIARRIAAEADILVFWYDDIPHASASGAVRIGLATGVPVLTSPTSWFRDLRGVTYQPSELIDGVKQLLDDTPKREQLTGAAREYCEMNSWKRIAGIHLALCYELEQA